MRLHGILGAESADAFAVRDLEVLDPWWIGGRYPDDAGEASADDASECVEASDRVVAGVGAWLARPGDISGPA